jgi:hypothetical protein
MSRSRAKASLLRCIGAIAVGMTLAAVAAPDARSSEPSTTDPRAPLVAYGSGTYIVVADRRQTRVSRVPRGYGGYSLGGNLLAKAYQGKGLSRYTVGYNARTGERKFRIPQTGQIPTVVRRGHAVAFYGQGHRDPYARSLWLRNGRGVERELVQFRFGGGGPGIPTGISEGFPMEYSFDRDAQTMAVAAGNDYVTFEYDIWTVDVSSGQHVRLTRGHRSRYPTVSPDGGRVAYFREDGICGGPMPGYRGGDIVIVHRDGTRRRVLHDGTCDRYLDRPRWLNRDHLMAIVHKRRPGDNPKPLYDSRLVLINARSGRVSRPISKTDRVGDVSVSPSAKRIAYSDWTKQGGFWVFAWQPGSGTPAEQVEWAQGHTVHFNEGTVPHLRGDSTLISSF